MAGMHGEGKRHAPLLFSTCALDPRHFSLGPLLIHKPSPTLTLRGKLSASVRAEGPWHGGWEVLSCQQSSQDESNTGHDAQQRVKGNKHRELRSRCHIVVEINSEVAVILVG